MTNTQERNAELYALYRKYMREDHTTHSEAVRAAVNSPASRFWLSPNYLCIVFSAIRKGSSPSPRRKLTKSPIYRQLYDDYLKLKDRPLYRNLPMEAICDLLVNRPAPSFFLSEKRADEIIRKVKSEK